MVKKDDVIVLFSMFVIIIHRKNITEAQKTDLCPLFKKGTKWTKFEVEFGTSNKGVFWSFMTCYELEKT